MLTLALLQREEDKADKLVQRAKAPMTKAKKKRTILTTQLTKLQKKLESKRGGVSKPLLLRNLLLDTPLQTPVSAEH